MDVCVLLATLTNRRNITTDDDRRKKGVIKLKKKKNCRSERVKFDLYLMSHNAKY